MDHQIIILDNDIDINGHLVLRFNYDFNIKKTNIEQAKSYIDKTLRECQEENSLFDDYILLLDLNSVARDKLDFTKVKKLLRYVQDAHPDKLSKCIVYNYSDIWKAIIELILTFTDHDTKKKICFKKKLSI